jgi:hypothetical protein
MRRKTLWRDRADAAAAAGNNLSQSGLGSFDAAQVAHYGFKGRCLFCLRTIYTAR